MPQSKKTSPISDLPHHLRGVMPPDAVVDDALRLSYYGYDGTFYEGKADIALLPETTEETSEAVRVCAEWGIPLVPRGAATSLSGGPVPLRGGAVFSFTRMDRILDLDYPNQRAVVQPGLVNLQFQGILAKNRFFYAPDPASQCVCTLGGNVGENSGGPHCLKYGVTANHILGLDMVMPDGTILRTGGKCLDPPGYDLTGLIVGSEGTFGLVTEMVCRIMPLPEAVVTMLAIFDTLSGASQSVSDIIAEGIIPATLEMMDNPTIRAVETHLNAGYPVDAEAVLLIELDGLKGALPDQVNRVAEVCNRNAVRDFRVAENDAERALLWKGRKGAFGAVVNIAPSKICTDISVPRTELPKALAAVVEIGRKYDIAIANVFHAGDGNLHPLILFDPRDHGQLERARKADQEITQLAVQYGGVLTGEHGIGCGKRQYMTLMFSPSELRLMHRIKDVFDPAGICNPDKVLPDMSEIAEPDAPKLTGRALDLQPLDQEAVRATLAVADRDGRKLEIRGSGTKLERGRESNSLPNLSNPALGRELDSLPRDASRLVLHLGRLNRIISHDYENLTVTAECGVTLRELDAVLAEKQQMLPCRPRFADRATLGGTIAANESGPSRLLYGSPRDFVTGIKAALPNGEVVSFGSSCVKNVAGYAVEKLLIGSMGTLGVILEMTLRTVPRPQALRTLAMQIERPSSADPFLAELLGSGLRPAAVELLNLPASKIVRLPSGWNLVVGLEGFVADVEEMARRLSTLAEQHRLGSWSEAESDYAAFWSAVAELGAMKTSCPITETAKLAERLDNGMPLHASPGLGLVYMECGSEVCGASAFHGTQTKAEAPSGDSASALQSRIKHAFDPNGVLPDITQ